MLLSCCLAAAGVSCSAAFARQAIHIKGGHFIGVTGNGASINGQPPGYYSGKPSGFGAGVRDHYRALNPHAKFG